MPSDLRDALRATLDEATPAALDRLFHSPDLLGWGRARALRSLPVDAEQSTWAQPVAVLGGVGVYRVDVPTLPPLSVRREHLEALNRMHEGSGLVYLGADGTIGFTRQDERQQRRPEIRTLTYHVGEGSRTTLDQLVRLRFSTADLDASGAARPSDVLRRLQEAFSVEEVTNRFFDAYKQAFDHAKSKITGLSDEARHTFTQRLFNRILFLRFLERKGWLRIDGRADYLRALWERRDPEQDLFHGLQLRLLFFYGLNARDAVPNGVVLEDVIGDVPFLNGGLFQEDDLDRNTAASVPDEALRPLFEDLLYCFNFTVTESTPLDIEVAVDPEMLGKVFERLVTDRGPGGKYYTARSVVSFMCREALKSFLGHEFDTFIETRERTEISLADAQKLRALLNDVRICDPACGSGAYLLGMMQELFDLHSQLDTNSAAPAVRTDYQRKLDLIQRNLYGVDKDPVAVDIARLRLWLALIIEYDGPTPEPLPNLDYKIEVGDSLVTPDPTARNVFGEAYIRLAGESNRLKSTYLDAHAASEKRRLAALIDANRDAIRTELAAGTDFDWRVDFAEVFAERPAYATLTGAFNFGQGLAPAPEPGGFDILVANPPYGGDNVPDALRDRYFAPGAESGQSKDPYGIFMARGLQLLRPGGTMSYVVSNTWRTLKTFRPLRRRLLEQTTIEHLLDLPPWIFEATVNTGIVTLRKARAPEGHRLLAADLAHLPKNDWAGLDENLVALAGHASAAQTLRFARYTYEQRLILRHDNLPFFIGSPTLFQLMHATNLRPLGSIAEARQGLATADNKYYIRRNTAGEGYEAVNPALVLTDAELAALTPDEKANGIDPAQHGGRHFVPYDKGGESDAAGGWLPNYRVPTAFYIDWSKAAVHRLKTATIAEVKQGRGEHSKIKSTDHGRIAARFQGHEYFFRPGITYSDSGRYAPTYRRSAGSAFDQKGSIIAPNSTIDRDGLLGLLCSTLHRYLLNVYINHSVSAQVDSIKLLPCVVDATVLARLSALVKRIARQQEINPRYPYWQVSQQAIDRLVFEAYGLSTEDQREVMLWFARSYRDLTTAQGVFADLEERHKAYLAWADNVLGRTPHELRQYPLYGLIARGESQTLEFKSSFRWDVKLQVDHKALRMEVLREIVALANRDGGTLLIGVDDNGKVLGLNEDYGFLSAPSDDRFELAVRDLLDSKVTPKAALDLTFTFHHVPEGVACQIDVRPLPKPLYAESDGLLYVRDGNRAKKLVGAARTDWLATRTS